MPTGCSPQIRDSITYSLQLGEALWCCPHAVWQIAETSKDEKITGNPSPIIFADPCTAATQSSFAVPVWTPVKHRLSDTGESETQSASKRNGPKCRTTQPPKRRGPGVACILQHLDEAKTAAERGSEEEGQHPSGKHKQSDLPLVTALLSGALHNVINRMGSKPYGKGVRQHRKTHSWGAIGAKPKP